jgi:glycosyltransferase involved in cell wall biosynthesis
MTTSENIARHQAPRPITTIGITSRHHGTYPTIRNAELQQVKLVDTHLFPQGTGLWSKFPMARNFFHSIGFPKPTKSVDLLHSYQKVLITSEPWIVSFDGLMPCYPRPYGWPALHDFVFTKLAGESCRAILPHSKNALQLMRARNSHSRVLGEVLNKTRVVYPAVMDNAQAYKDCIRETCPNGDLRVLFVGRQFFQKGGHLLTDAILQIRDTVKVSYTLVSELSLNDWTSIRTNDDRVRALEALKQLGANRYENIANAEVRRLMGEADILVLPSIDESFGFVILEAFATGLPVIGTNWRAMPELISHGINGLLVDGRSDEGGFLDRTGSYEADITRQLCELLAALAKDKSKLVEMKHRARETYLARFTPALLGKALSEVYGSACS